MTYDAESLHGVWENLDDDSILKVETGGDFRLTPGSDSPVSDDPSVSVVGDISGKWAVNDSKLNLSVDPRSVRFSAPSRMKQFVPRLRAERIAIRTDRFWNF